VFDKKNIQQAIDLLKQQFGDSLSTSPSVLEQHGHTTTRLPNQAPDAVIFV